MSISPFILNAGSEESELLVYGTIGKSWWDDESVDAKTVVKQLAALPKTTKKITVRINSFGGSLSDGFAIFNALKAHSASVTAIVDGVAMSAASLIAMAADSIEMPATSMMMIHAPSCGAHGNAAELRKAAEVLDKFADAMVSAYTSKTGKSEEEIKALLDGQDHFYTGAEAVAAGFADKLIGEASATAWYDVAVNAVFQAGYKPKNPTQESPVTVETPKLDSTADAVAALKAEIDAMKASNAADAQAAASTKAELEAVRASLAAEVEAKEVRAVVAEVGAAYKHLAVKAEDFGPAIRALRRASPEACALVEAALKSADAMVSQTMDPIGSAVSVPAGTVRGQIDVLIKAKREANKKLSPEKAELQVFEENPALYNALRAEQV